MLTVIFLQKSYSNRLPEGGYMVSMDKINPVAQVLTVLTLAQAIAFHRKVIETEGIAKEHIQRTDRLGLAGLSVAFVVTSAGLVFPGIAITVSGPTPGVTYNLYRYNKVSSVPTGSLNAHAAEASQRWAIRVSSGTTFAKTLTIQSHETAAFRAVPASAP